MTCVFNDVKGHECIVPWREANTLGLFAHARSALNGCHTAQPGFRMLPSCTVPHPEQRADQLRKRKSKPTSQRWRKCLVFFPLLPYFSSIFPSRHFMSFPSLVSQTLYFCLPMPSRILRAFKFLALLSTVQECLGYFHLVSFCLCSPGSLDRSGPLLPPR